MNPPAAAPGTEGRAQPAAHSMQDATRAAISAARYPLTLTINGRPLALEVQSWTTLLDLLRDQLDLTGSKKGCDHGQCGACTVLVDGRRINACLTLAVMQQGRAITTVEGLAEDVEGQQGLHPLQRAFIEHDAFQCGYCTPGQLCSAAGLLAEGQVRNRDDVRELMSGNVCRCGAYPQIADAISQVAFGAADGGQTGATGTAHIGTVPA